MVWLFLAFCKIHFLSGWDRRGPKTFKTNEVVWDAKMIAMNTEKMFWTAEIEIYRLGTSNGPPGYKKCEKRSPCFRFLGRCDNVILLTARILMFWCSGRLWKLKFRPPKIDFGSKFYQKQLKIRFYDFCLVSFFQILFLVFFWFWWKN